MGLILFAFCVSLCPLLLAVLHDLRTPGLVPLYFIHYQEDTGVYMAWITQAAEGNFVTRNLFAPGSPSNYTVYLLFWAWGRLQALLHMGTAPFYGLVTAGSAAVLLATAWGFTRSVFNEPRFRLLALAFVCFGSGLGWVHSYGGRFTPIDFMQLEVFTFTCLYTPHFSVCSALIVGTFWSAWVAARDRAWRPLLVTIPCVALLANSHTYDVLTVGSVWLVYVVTGWVRRRRVDGLEAAQTALVGIAAAVPTLLNFVALKKAGVLAMREVYQTPAFPPSMVLIGLGLLTPFAILALLPRATAVLADLGPRTLGSRRLLATWAAVPLVIQYVPSTFQRKLLLGIHVPLALLAAMGFLFLWRVARPNLRPLVVALGLLVPLSCAKWTVSKSRIALHPTPLERYVMWGDEERALLWLRDHAEPGTVIQPMLYFGRRDPHSDRRWVGASTAALMTPGFTGHPVYCAHFTETPGFVEKLDEFRRFAASATPDDDRIAWLRKARIEYLVLSDKDCPPSDDLVFRSWRDSSPSYLRLLPEASTDRVRTYRVVGTEHGRREPVEGAQASMHN